MLLKMRAACKKLVTGLRYGKWQMAKVYPFHSALPAGHIKITRKNHEIFSIVR
jgi:hypothetical protein